MIATEILDDLNLVSRQTEPLNQLVRSNIVIEESDTNAGSFRCAITSHVKNGCAQGLLNASSIFFLGSVKPNFSSKSLECPRLGIVGSKTQVAEKGKTNLCSEPRKAHRTWRCHV